MTPACSTPLWRQKILCRAVKNYPGGSLPSRGKRCWLHIPKNPDERDRTWAIPCVLICNSLGFIWQELSDIRPMRTMVGYLTPLVASVCFFEYCTAASYKGKSFTNPVLIQKNAKLSHWNSLTSWRPLTDKSYLLGRFNDVIWPVCF